MQGLLPGEEIKYQTQAYSSKKAGTLAITNFRVLWAPTGNDTIIPTIKKQLKFVESVETADAEGRALMKIYTKGKEGVEGVF